jgi:hypothetical protein
MVHLPDKLSREHIISEFKKGDILRWESFHGKKEIKDRFFVLLTPASPSEGTILAVTATTKVELYADDGGKRKFRDYILLKKGECEIFDKDTVIDLNWIEHFSVEEMAKILGQGLKRAGCLSALLTEKLEQKIKDSKLISIDYKKRILGI